VCVCVCILDCAKVLFSQSLPSDAEWQRSFLLTSVVRHPSFHQFSHHLLTSVLQNRCVTSNCSIAVETSLFTKFSFFAVTFELLLQHFQLIHLSKVWDNSDFLKWFFERSLFCLPMLYWFDQKYGKNSYELNRT